MPNTTTTLDQVLETLERDGVAIVPAFATGAWLAGMQRAFRQSLARPRWNTFDGYRQTELFRHMVEDVLLLDQGFVDLAVHPLVAGAARGYVGLDVQLREAKGWLSLLTARDFHGWHGDAWYDQSQVTDRIPREVKAAMYLTDVRSGAFAYVKGSHRQQAPRMIRKDEVGSTVKGDVLECFGAAGTLVLFDTSGVHRQNMPILEPRWAVFYNYHQPSVPLQREDTVAYRYHPLLLNAAFLGKLGEEERRLLGFGDQAHYQPDWERPERFAWIQAAARAMLVAKLRIADLPNLVKDVIRPLMK